MYPYIEPDFIEKYALTNDEVDEAIKNGILADRENKRESSRE